MPFVAAVSEHPVAADAVGDVLGTIAERGGLEPDLVAVFVGEAHREFVGEITAAIHTVLRPGALIGSTASGIVGRDREVEDQPALSVWAAWIGPVSTVRLTVETVEAGTAVVGIPGDVPHGATLVLLADPLSFPAASLVAELAEIRPDISVVGGLASGAAAPTLLRDRDRHRDGAVGVVVPAEYLAGSLVSQGSRPLGDPMTVTASDRQYVVELAGQPALDRLTALTESLGPDERVLAARGVELGTAIDEARHHHRSGDFVVRSILGADRARGVLALAEHVPVGSTACFHVRDAAAADADLRTRLQSLPGDGALVFTCNGRGQTLFGVDDHDAATVVDETGTDAVAGMFCVGEMGSTAGRSHVHAFSASVLVFADR